MTQSDFGRLYEANVRKIYDYLYYRTHHRETAEDLTSLAFTKAFEHLDDVKDGAAFMPWIYRIARNSLIDHWRKVRPTTDIEDVWDILKAGGDIIRDIDARDRLAQVEKLISTLPAAQREIVLLRVWDGFSHAEIASMTGKKEGAVKVAYSRAISELRKKSPLALALLMLLK